MTGADFLATAVASAVGLGFGDTFTDAFDQSATTAGLTDVAGFEAAGSGVRSPSRERLAARCSTGATASRFCVPCGTTRNAPAPPVRASATATGAMMERSFERFGATPAACASSWSGATFSAA